MLYNLAKRGEIDPLNIDVVDVADKFLKELEMAKKLDLRIPAKVLLYAAILVRMKSEIIANEAISCEREDEEFTEEFNEFVSQDFISDEIESDEKIVKALITNRRAIRRFTTLDDLIRELKMAEKVQKRREKRKKSVKLSFDPFKIPHEEDLERIINVVRERIFKAMEKRDKIKMSEIEGVDLISKYISILHLAYRRIFEIHQEKIFESDIEIRRIKNAEEN